MNRILGIDFGESRIGLAISDPLQIIARPLQIINVKQTPEYIFEIHNVIKIRNVSRVVVGLPITLKGGHSEQTIIVKKFIDELKKKLDIPIVHIDERLSSVAAKKSLQLQNIKTKCEKGLIDQTAAAIILQEYLDSRF